MSALIQWFNKRKLERMCLLLIGIIMGLLFWKLFSVLQRDFAEVDTRMENGTMINLNTGKPVTDGTEMRAARQRIFHDRERPSRLTLPVVPMA